jgi:hypothetical protein
MVYVFTFSQTAGTKRAGAEDKLVKRINSGGGPYLACDKTTPVAGCSVDDAAILIYGTDGTGDNLTMNAREDLQGAGGPWLGSLSLTTAEDIADLGQDQVQSLLGGVQLVDGKLVAVPGGYQQFVQLVPQNVAATDPDYSGLLAFELGQRGIVAYPSSFTLGSVGSNPSQAACLQGAEYFVYRLTVNTVPHPLIGFTRIGVTVTGNFINCNDLHNISAGFSGEARTNIPTTSGSALTYASLLKFVFPKLGWATVTLALGSASGLVDKTPDSLEVRGAAGEVALRNLVEHFCETRHFIEVGLPSPTPTPVPTQVPFPTPTPVPTQVPFPTPTPPGSPSQLEAHIETLSGTSLGNNPASGQTATTQAGPTLDPGAAAIGPVPYDPICHPVFPAPTPPA